MRPTKTPSVSSLAIAIRYRDVAAAVEWLSAAFDFERQVSIADETGAVVYAQLTFGNALVMLAPVRDTPLDSFMKQPDEIGGAETQSCYIVVDDVDAHFARATTAGAEVVLDMATDDLGGRGYSCRDPEGHLWNFGTSDPWQRRSINDPRNLSPSAASDNTKRWTISAGLAILLAASTAAIGWVGGTRWHADVAGAFVQEAQEKAIQERAAKLADERAARLAQQLAEPERVAKEAAENAARAAGELADRERAARTAAEQALAEAARRLAADRSANEAAARAAADLRAQLDQERAAVVGSQTAREDALKLVALERSAREDAERALERAQQEVAKENTAREAAERALEQAQQRISQASGAGQATELALDQARQRATQLTAAKAAADRALEQVQQQVAKERSAREAAERAERTVREQLEREQKSKAAAWKAASQLRKQLVKTPVASDSGTTAPGYDSGAAAMDTADPQSAVQRKKKSQE